MILARLQYLKNPPEKNNLTNEEWDIMKRHSEIGHNIVFASPQLAHIGEAILLPP